MKKTSRSLGFLERHWNAPNSGQYGGWDGSGNPSLVNDYPDVGWRGGPGDPPVLPSYIATVTTMKALVDLGMIHLTVDDAELDWFDDFSDVIVANQDEDGFWLQGGYPTGYGALLDSQFALLTLLRAAPEDPVIHPDLENPVKRPVEPEDPDYAVLGTVTLEVFDGVRFKHASRINIGHGGAHATGSVELPLGAFDFTLINVPVGGEIVMKITPPAAAFDPDNPDGFLNADGTIKDGLNWFKIEDDAWKGLADVPISLMPESGPPFTHILVYLKDGGPEDQDGVANGIIVDPGAPGVGAVQEAPTSPGTPSGLSGGGSSGCFIVSAAAGPQSTYFPAMLLFLVAVALGGLALVRRRG